MLSSLTAFNSNAASYKIIIPKQYKSMTGYVGDTISPFFVLTQSTGYLNAFAYDDVKYSSSDSSIIKTSSYGEIKCKKVGTATLTLKYKTASAKIKVTVKENGVECPSQIIRGYFDKEGYPLRLYGSFYENSDVTVTSSNKKILTVSKDSSTKYLLIPHATGKATISVNVGDSHEEFDVTVSSTPKLKLTKYKAKMKNKKAIGVSITLKNSSNFDIYVSKLLTGDSYGLTEYCLKNPVTIKAGKTKTIYIKDASGGYMQYAFNQKGKLYSDVNLGISGLFSGQSGYCYFKHSGNIEMFVQK